MKRISIITINLNNAAGLERTFQSVIGQRSRDFEYVVIDGGSSDGSKEIIRRFAERIDSWVSEPDNGIYHAMNKGIRASAGEYCLFLNSGDYLYGADVIERLIRTSETGKDVYYSDLPASAGMTEPVRFPKRLGLGFFFSGTLNHQNTLIKKSCLELLGMYNEANRIQSDWEFFLRAAYFHHASFGRIDYHISYYTLDGISSDPKFEDVRLEEIKKVLLSVFGEKNAKALIDCYKFKYSVIIRTMIDAFGRSKGLWFFLGIYRCYAMIRKGYKNVAASNPDGFAWSLGYAQDCDVSPFRTRVPAGYSTNDYSWRLNPRVYARNPGKGDLVWVASRYLPEFIRECLPRIKAPFALVVSDGDESFPSGLPKDIRVGDFIGDPRILTIFAQNYDGTVKDPKIHPLPIGLDFHSMNRKGGAWGEGRQSAREQEERLERLILGLPPIRQRIQKAFVDFHLSDRTIYDGTRRSDVFRALKASGCVEAAESPMARSELWARKGRYAFSVSPHGNGLDCHRTWEDLALGCIVIVKTSALDPLYDGLPVAIVEDWSEVSEGALAGWMSRFGGLSADPMARRRLRSGYWMDRIRDEAGKAMASSR